MAVLTCALGRPRSRPAPLCFPDPAMIPWGSDEGSQDEGRWVLKAVERYEGATRSPTQGQQSV